VRTPRIIAGAILGAVVAALAGATPALADGGTGAIAGNVRDTRGTVIADAVVTIYPPESSPNIVAQTRTDAAGKFKVIGLDEGSYKVDIRLGGWSEWAPGRIENFDAAPAYPVVPGRTTRASSVVSAPGVITGRLVTATGTPAAGVAVSADEENTARTWSATTAADGTYQVKVHPGGDYIIGFRDGSFQQFAPHTVDRSSARHFTVGSGHTIRVNDRLLPAASLSGRLVDAAGAPVVGAQVHYLTMNASEQATTTDAAGNYSFTKLNPGDIKVYFVTADGVTQWAYQAQSYDEATTFTLTLGQTTTVDDQLLG